MCLICAVEFPSSDGRKLLLLFYHYSIPHMKQIRAQSCRVPGRPKLKIKSHLFPIKFLFSFHFADFTISFVSRCDIAITANKPFSTRHSLSQPARVCHLIEISTNANINLLKSITHKMHPLHSFQLNSSATAVTDAAAAASVVTLPCTVHAKLPHVK